VTARVSRRWRSGAKGEYAPEQEPKGRRRRRSPFLRPGGDRRQGREARVRGRGNEVIESLQGGIRTVPDRSPAVRDRLMRSGWALIPPDRDDGEAVPSTASEAQKRLDLAFWRTARRPLLTRIQEVAPSQPSPSSLFWKRLGSGVEIGRRSPRPGCVAVGGPEDVPFTCSQIDSVRSGWVDCEAPHPLVPCETQARWQPRLATVARL
jgi:hypothetical protein